MKNNTQNLKFTLLQALKEVPDDFTLSEVKSHIRAAIFKIEEVEKKRVKKEQLYQSRQQSGFFANPKETIKMIDEEIAKENEKLSKIKNKQMLKDDDDGDIQPMFG